MADPHAISIIVPTLARAQRAALLRGALSSVRRQSGVRTTPIVVVNGPWRDPALVASLEDEFGFRAVVTEEADLPAALQLGRARVETAYFAELDDDDELLPGALALRLQKIEEHPRADVVITNGILRGLSTERLLFDVAEVLSRDPLRALLRLNWLAPGGALFRTAGVGPDLFAGIPHHAEWTYVATRLCLSCRIRFLDDVTFLYRHGSPFALTRTPEYVTGAPAAIERLLELDLPAWARRGFERKHRQACHHAADVYRLSGDLRMAWRWHWRSLRGRGGWRHLAFTQHLLRDAMTRNRVEARETALAGASTRAPRDGELPNP